jgi:hypothetical protein
MNPMSFHLALVVFASTDIITLLILLVAVWAVLSLPVYIAAKMVTSGRASFLAAMGATLLGPIVYAITIFIASILLGAFTGFATTPLALIIAFIAWLAVYKSVFNTGWFGAFLIAILAAIVFAVVSLLIANILGPATPAGFFDVQSF